MRRGSSAVHTRVRSQLAILFLTAAVATDAAVQAALPLHQQIDALVAAKAGKVPLAGPADDAEFLRRATLDFAGEIPSADEVRAFLADKAADKRARLIDRLFAGSRYAGTMAGRFDVMLMERRGEDAQWRGWLEAAFRDNKPWDAMAREMLNPDFADPLRNGAGHFITKRLESYGQNAVDYPGLTRDVGRMFMGVDLQCTQCHKHLTVKDYKQVDFQGLFVAFQNLKLQTPNDTFKVRWTSEGLLTKEMEFSSVLTEIKGATGPRVPFGQSVAIPTFEKGQEWLEAPARPKNTPGKPKFSPLSEITQRLVAPDNANFTRNIANRVWFLQMGRGLFEPLDLAHSENPPSHPELLDLLARELQAHKFDLKWLLRELALTQTYQRSSVLMEAAAKSPEELYVAAKERPIAAEALVRSVLIATGELERVGKLPKVERKKDAKDTPRPDTLSLEEMTAAFQSAFANAAREPELSVSPTLKGALFMRNSSTLRTLLQPREGNLADRLLKLKEPAQIADTVYLHILSRPPTAEERAEVVAWLARQKSAREETLANLAWALLASAEFFVNH